MAVGAERAAERIAGVGAALELFDGARVDVAVDGDRCGHLAHNVTRHGLSVAGHAHGAGGSNSGVGSDRMAFAVEEATIESIQAALLAKELSVAELVGPIWSGSSTSIRS